jgi:hypothetical protein
MIKFNSGPKMNQTNEKPFKGADFMDKQGVVELPKDAKDTYIGTDSASLSFSSKDKEHRLYINKSPLNSVLLEVNGANLFRIIQGRFMVLAKVKNIHLPFYISSTGESGKNQGEWYPFFGLTEDGWIVKGSVEEGGKMEYHPEITKVQNILNDNLKIPEKFISPRGTIINNEKEVIFDLNKHFKYQNPFFDDNLKKLKNSEYVKRVTGYNPKNLPTEQSSKDWISHVVNEIE